MLYHVVEGEVVIYDVIPVVHELMDRFSMVHFSVIQKKFIWKLDIGYLFKIVL